MEKSTILFYISFGHGANGDPGAVSGKFIERDINRKACDALYKYLLKVPGRTYKVAYPEKDGRGRSLAEHNRHTQNYKKKGYRVVSIDFHMNAGGGDGMEVYISTLNNAKEKYGKKLGKLVVSEFKKIGQNTHGTPIKVDNTLLFLKGNAGVPILIEGGFVDNKTDRKLFDTNKKIRAMGVATAKACVKYWEEMK